MSKSLDEKLSIPEKSTKKKQEELNVVGIGASAGGLDAIQQLFNHIP